MIDRNEYLSFIRKGQIPPQPPFVSGWADLDSGSIVNEYEARGQCTRRGMWPIVDKIWTGMLADWIGNRIVLEVMAGGGWIAKALHEHGVIIKATDDFSWDISVHENLNPVFPIIKLDAVQAIDEVPADALLVSWPPYEDNTIIKVCDLWGTDKPIIYIGEGWGGCNAPEEFFDHFERIDPHPEIPLQQWRGLHDYVEIGFWTRKDSQ